MTIKPNKIFEDIDFSDCPEWYRNSFKMIIDRYQTLTHFEMYCPIGSGKSTFAVKTAYHIDRLYGLDVIIVSRNSNAEHYLKTICNNHNIPYPKFLTKELSNLIGKRYKHCIVIFDDCEKFLEEIMESCFLHCLFVEIKMS